MTLWETQLAEEAARNAQWEEINDIPEEEEEETVQFASVVDQIDIALDDLAEATDYIKDAAKILDGDPLADKILSVLVDVEKVGSFLDELHNTVKELARKEGQIA